MTDHNQKNTPFLVEPSMKGLHELIVSCAKLVNKLSNADVWPWAVPVYILFLFDIRYSYLTLLDSLVRLLPMFFHEGNWRASSWCWRISFLKLLRDIVATSAIGKYGFTTQHGKYIRHILTSEGSQPRSYVCLLIFYGFKMFWNWMYWVIRWVFWN